MLQRVGGFCALAGVLSSALYFVGYNLRILMWVDMMGPVAAWAIRLGLVVVGGALWFVGLSMSAKEDEAIPVSVGHSGAE
ncbi:MAG: hypothetical protein U0169_15645 [Polyangiaceae bacterium]